MVTVDDGSEIRCNFKWWCFDDMLLKDFLNDVFL